MREGWVYKKLGEVCETSSGGTPSKSHMEYYEGGKIPWLRSGEVSQGLIYDTELYITELGLEKSSAKIFPIDTVVIAMYGATVGQVGLLKRKISTNQAICGIFPNSTIFPMFLLYCLKSKKTIFLKDAVGGAQPNISQNIIKNTIIPVPPLSEQQRIVSELDLLSSIIEKKKAQLKEYDQLAQSIFYDMFGDPVTNEKGWVVKKLGEVCVIVRGGSPRPIDKFLGGDIPWIKIGDATKGDDIYLYSTKEHIIQEGLNKTRYIPNGSLIFANCGVSLGFARIIKFEGCIHDGWLALMDINEKELNKVFLLKSLNACTMYFRKLAPDGTQPNLNTQIMKGFKQIVPPISLQDDFVGMIEAIERQKALVQQSITEAETLFNSRMDYWFS